MKLPQELTTVTQLSKLLALILFFALPIIGFFLGIRYQQQLQQYKPSNKKMVSNTDLSKHLIQQIPSLTRKEISWFEPYHNQQEGFTDIPADGYARVGSLISDTADIDDSEITSSFLTNGWQQDSRFDSSSPAGNMEGYRIIIDGKQYILLFSYENNSMEENEFGMMQSKQCPCTIKFSAFVSSAF